MNEGWTKAWLNPEWRCDEWTVIVKISMGSTVCSRGYVCFKMYWAIIVEITVVNVYCFPLFIYRTEKVGNSALSSILGQNQSQTSLPTVTRLPWNPTSSQQSNSLPVSVQTDNSNQVWVNLFFLPPPSLLPLFQGSFLFSPSIPSSFLLTPPPSFLLLPSLLPVSLCSSSSLSSSLSPFFLPPSLPSSFLPSPSLPSPSPFFLPSYSLSPSFLTPSSVHLPLRLSLVCRICLYVCFGVHVCMAHQILLLLSHSGPGSLDNWDPMRDDFTSPTFNTYDRGPGASLPQPKATEIKLWVCDHFMNMKWANGVWGTPVPWHHIRTLWFSCGFIFMIFVDWKPFAYIYVHISPKS